VVASYVIDGSCEKATSATTATYAYSASATTSAATANY
jgi:hypothetical protein